MQSFVEPLCCPIYFTALGVAQWLQSRVGSMELMELRVGRMPGVGFCECVEGSSTCGCQAGAAGSGCVGTLVGKEAQPCTQVKLSQQLLRAHTGVRTSVSSAFYKSSSLRLQNPPRRRILAEEQSWFV